VNVGLPDGHDGPLEHISLGASKALFETPSGSVVDEDEVVE
jgi:hypothetical protein